MCMDEFNEGFVEECIEAGCTPEMTTILLQEHIDKEEG